MTTKKVCSANCTIDVFDGKIDSVLVSFLDKDAGIVELRTYVDLVHIRLSDNPDPIKTGEFFISLGKQLMEVGTVANNCKVLTLPQTV